MYSTSEIVQIEISMERYGGGWVRGPKTPVFIPKMGQKDVKKAEYAFFGVKLAQKSFKMLPESPKYGNRSFCIDSDCVLYLYLFITAWRLLLKHCVPNLNWVDIFFSPLNVVF